MSEIAVHAYSFAATFKLKELLPIFGGDARVEKDRLLVTFGGASWGIAYDFGAVVLIGVPAAERQKIAEALIKKIRGEPHPPLEESFVIENGAAQPEVRFDRVMVP